MNDIISIIMLVISFFIVFLFGDTVSVSVYNSLIFCGKTIVPSLFVYMILSEVFIEAKLIEKISNVLNKYFHINNKKSIALSIISISSLCGAPFGAKLSFSAFNNGTLSKKEAIVLNAATNNISLSFVYGVCQTKLSLYKEVFFIMLISSMISALILMKTIKVVDGYKLGANVKNEFRLSKVIINTTNSMIGVCASIITFTVVGDILEKLIPFLPQIIKGIFEFSSGVCNLRNESFLLTTLILSFGGFSLHNQIYTVWESELKYKYIFFPKLLQGIISIFFCEIFLLFVDKTKYLL